MDVEQLRGVLEVASAQRANLADQVELERTVLRPPRQGRLPAWGNDELLAGYERTLALYDELIGKAQQALETQEG